MIGHVIMEIEADEMRTAIAYYLNNSVFMVQGYPSREYHKAVVASVKQRKGRFIIEFEGKGLRPAQSGGYPDSAT